jgi:hypothetical protein
MTDIALKYNLLDDTAKKEVLDFVDFLLNKKGNLKESDSSDYKKRLLQVSKWEEADIDLLIKNQQKLNQWNVQKW